MPGIGSDCECVRLENCHTQCQCECHKKQVNPFTCTDEELAEMFHNNGRRWHSNPEWVDGQIEIARRDRTKVRTAYSSMVGGWCAWIEGAR